MKSILDPSFRYVNSASTDLRKTFARVRREQADLARAKAEQEAREAVAHAGKVHTITRRKVAT